MSESHLFLARWCRESMSAPQEKPNTREPHHLSLSLLRAKPKHSNAPRPHPHCLLTCRQSWGLLTAPQCLLCDQPCLPGSLLARLWFTLMETRVLLPPQLLATRL